MLEAPNPILIEITRGAGVESCHRGAFAVAVPDGGVLDGCGAVHAPIFARSALKLVKALPFLETGAADAFACGDEEVVLAAASHSGEPGQIALLRRWADRVGLPLEAFRCGAHAPFSREAGEALRAAKLSPDVLFNNNAGMHAAFLTTAAHRSEPLEGYDETSHPVQRRVGEAILALAHDGAEPAPVALERCGAPAWRVSLRGLARAMAAFARAEEGQGGVRPAAMGRLSRAAWRFPALLVGTGRLSSQITQTYAGDVLVKGGSEGVYAGFSRRLGVGFALKIDDGSQRAADSSLVAVLDRVGVPDILQRMRDLRGDRQSVTTTNGRPSGTIRWNYGAAAIVDE